jgi:hypothetical protein
LIVPGEGDPEVATYEGTLWGDGYVSGPLPQDINQATIYRSQVYSSLSYGFVRIGFWSIELAADRMVSFFDGPRLSMGALIGSAEFVPFGDAATSEDGPDWCDLFDGVCGWGYTGDLSVGYNATWSGGGVRVGLAARQDQRSCADPVPTYMGVGGSNQTAGILRSYAAVRNSNCQGNLHTRALNSKVWVR